MADGRGMWKYPRAATEGHAPCEFQGPNVAVIHDRSRRLHAAPPWSSPSPWPPAGGGVGQAGMSMSVASDGWLWNQCCEHVTMVAKMETKCVLVADHDSES